MRRILLPGSKSLTNRALVIAALASGTTRISGALRSEDTDAMSAALKALHVPCNAGRSGTKLTVKGGAFHAPNKTINVKNAGTAMRFLTAMLTLQPFASRISGNARMRHRPIGDLVSALQQIGAKISYEKKKGYPPLRIFGGGLRGGTTASLKGNVSSQFLSGMLLAAPYAERDVTVSVLGNLTSKPYIDMTIDLMKQFGVTVSRQKYREFRVKAGQRYRARAIKIEPDASSAVYFWCRAALMSEAVETVGLSRKSIQADIAILDFLEKIGAHVSEGKNGIVVKGRKILKALGTIDANHCPDGAMALAVMAAFLPGQSSIMGLQTLTVKETDRLSALRNELMKLGVRVKKTRDSLTIYGNPENIMRAHGASAQGGEESGFASSEPSEPTKKGARGASAPTKKIRIETYNDHRMAMSFALAQLKIPQIAIKNPGCVKKTYPNFWNDWK